MARLPALPCHGSRPGSHRPCCTDLHDRPSIDAQASEPPYVRPFLLLSLSHPANHPMRLPPFLLTSVRVNSPKAQRAVGCIAGQQDHRRCPQWSARGPEEDSEWRPELGPFAGRRSVDPGVGKQGHPPQSEGAEGSFCATVPSLPRQFWCSAALLQEAPHAAIMG